MINLINIIFQDSPKKTETNTSSITYGENLRFQDPRKTIKFDRKDSHDGDKGIFINRLIFKYSF